MNEISKKINERKEFLLKLKYEKESSLKNCSDGQLRISLNGKNPRYYQSFREEGKCDKYLSLKEMNLIRELAQKSYDIKIWKSVTRELNAIERYLNSCPKVVAEQIYEMMHLERQKRIVPIAPGREQIRNEWLAVEQEGKGVDERVPEIYTDKGERVRSKSELLIANELFRADIPYRYEYPVYIKRWGTIYPDFMVFALAKKKEVYWEHFGRMDDPEYAEKAVQKIEAYAENGYVIGDNLIVTFETRQSVFTTRKVQMIIEQYLL